MMLSSLTHQTIIYVFHGSDAAMNGTESANVIPYLKNGMTEQPAALPSHFCYAKDERDLRARGDLWTPINDRSNCINSKQSYLVNPFQEMYCYTY